jgi:TolB protein
MAPRLEVTRGENTGETYKVKLTTRIGRERDNNIILADPKVSRYHAEIKLQNGVWTLIDLDSANKTYVNGAPITAPVALQPGDRLGFGELELTFRVPGIATTETEVPRRAKTPAAAPPPAGSATPARPPQPAVPSTRLTWFAGGFIALLAIIAIAVFAYAVFGRTAAPTPAAPASENPADPGGNNDQTDSSAGAARNLSLIYEDDFSNSFGGWDDAFDTYTTKQYGNNRYQIEVTASNLVAWGLANRDVADFEIEVDVRLEDGDPKNSYGLLFRFEDRDNFYRFDISGDGYYLLSKFYHGQWETLVDWTKAPSLNTDSGANNVLKVSAFGPEISAAVNGQLLTTLTDTSMQHGNFGFFASTFSDPYAWVSYDNLKLWVPAGQENAITMIPTPMRFVSASPTAAPSPTGTPTPVEVAQAEATPSPTPAEPTATITPTPEPTATPVPLPEYASRDQTLARGEAKVSGRIIFPLYDAARNTYDVYMADTADGGNLTLVQANASQPGASTDGTEIAYRSWQPDKRGLFARPLAGGDAWGFDLFFESARPQYSPADNSLMYHSRTGGKEPAIYRVINGIGQVMRRESFPIQGHSAKWSPDGQQFVYSSCLGSKCGIILSNIDGASPVLLTDHPTDTNPEFSPDGKLVVFTSQRGGDWEIYRVAIGGGNITALTADDATDGLPTWSPNGDKIAFVSNRDGEWAVWDMDADGSNQRRLFALNGSVDGIVQHDIANSRGWVEENIDWIP